MALRWPANVQATTITTGTGTYTVTEPVINGKRSFTQAVAAGDLANGDTVVYSCVDGTTPNSLEFGIGQWDNTAKTLTRSVLQPSTGPVSWGAGTRDLYVCDRTESAALLASANVFTALQTILASGTAITPSAATQLLIQASATAGTACRVSVISGTGARAQLNLGNTGTEAIAGIALDNSTGTAYLRSGGSDRVALTSAGAFGPVAGGTYVFYPNGGTVKMLFASAPPTGWTRVDETSSRVIRLATSSDTPGATGGSANIFTGSWNTGSHTLTISEMPAHTHTVTMRAVSAPSGASFVPDTGTFDSTVTQNTGSAGSGAGHIHPISAPLHTVAVWGTYD